MTSAFLCTCGCPDIDHCKTEVLDTDGHLERIVYAECATCPCQQFTPAQCGACGGEGGDCEVCFGSGYVPWPD